MAGDTRSGVIDPGVAHAVAQSPGARPLPGDIQIKHKRGVFYFPFASVILMSLVLSLFAYLLGR
jgi:hypothetical protein